MSERSGFNANWISDGEDKPFRAKAMILVNDVFRRLVESRHQGRREIIAEHQWMDAGSARVPSPFRVHP